jgi:outer membrane protein insertion porin family
MKRPFLGLVCLTSISCAVQLAARAESTVSAPKLTVTGDLTDAAPAIADMLADVLAAAPLAASEQRELLLRAASCRFTTPTSAPSSRPAGAPEPAAPLTTDVSAAEGGLEQSRENAEARDTAIASTQPTTGPSSGPTSQAPTPSSQPLDQSDSESKPERPSSTQSQPATTPPGASEQPTDACEAALAPRSPLPPSRDQITRWISTLLDEQLGYCIKHVQLREQRLVVHLRRFHVVRRVRVRGNWPIFEEEFLRRLSLRPGQRVPEGPELTRSLKSQQERLKRFLARRGYFEGKLAITLSPPDEAGRVDVDLRIEKGESYKVGRIVVEPMGTPGGRRRGPARRRWVPAIPREEIEELFRDQIVFYRRNFNTARCKRHVQELIERYHARGYPGVRIKDDCTKLPKQIDDRGVRITLRIRQRKQITVQYRGNDSISSSDLDEALTLAEAGAYDTYELAQSAARLRKTYQSEGFLQARVRFTRRTLPSRDVVTFQIEEGPRFHIESVAFDGNRSLADDRLRTVVKTQTYPLWGLGEGGHVTDVQLRQDAKRIAKLYRSEGFSSVRVRADIAPDRRLLGRPGALSAAIATGAANRGELFVRFTVDEGPRTIVKQIEIVGMTLLTEAQLLDQISLRHHRAFTRRRLAQSLERIRRLYFERGHPYAQVRIGCLRTAKDGSNIELLRLVVDEGHPVRVGSVLLRGNPRTRASVIRSALGLRPSDPFDIRDLERGELKLRRLGVFNSVRIQVLGLKARLSQVPILVTVEERYDDHGAIELGVGGSTDNAVFGSVGYNWSNAFGFGANLRVRGEVGPQIQSGNLDAVYPRAFGTDFGLEFQLFVRNELTVRLGPLTTYGGALTVSRELLRDLRALLSYSLRRVETEEPVNRPSGDFDEAADAPVNTRTGALSASLIYDRRDNPLAPSRGFRLAGRLTWASEYLAGNADFLKLRLNGQAYIPLPLDLTIAFGVRYDHGIPLRGAELLPRVERFFAGGDTTLRGFEEDRAFAERIESPLGPLDGPTMIRLVAQGGNIRLLTNLELQFPIWKESLLLGLPLMGAIFLDNGLVTNSFDRFDIGAFRHGLGGALRIVTLVGFLSIEYAFPLDPQVGDPKDGRFHVNFGFIF